MYDISELKTKKLLELRDLAKELSITKVSQLKKQDLVYRILDFQASNPQLFTGSKSDRSNHGVQRIKPAPFVHHRENNPTHPQQKARQQDRKSTRLNS
ncbi:MAG: Rho termination factor N-terminal domain-containing protein, partial [Flavobacteriales bacterium]